MIIISTITLLGGWGGYHNYGYIFGYRTSLFSLNYR